MGSSGTVRSRVRAAIMGTVALALLLAGVPLGITVAGLYRGQAEARLDGEAARVLAAVPDEKLGSAARLPRPTDAGTTLGLYAGGRRIAGQGPRQDSLAALSGRVHEARRAVAGSDLVVTAPFRRDEGDTVVVRAAQPYREVLDRSYAAWGLMLVLAALILLIAWVVAARRARTLGQPFERLTADAQALGAGDFAVAPRRTGLVEADAASRALGETAQRLGALLERERSFSADASHQLRTPLTRLRLGLESALLDPRADREQALRAAVHRLDGLEETVDSLLALARDTGSPRSDCDVADVVREVAADARAGGGPFEVARIEVGVEPGLPPAACHRHALAQVLHVLVDNAVQHGSGCVRVQARAAGTGVAVDVTDEGPGLGREPELAFVRRSPDARGTGIGLALARSLTEAEGGRLVVGGPGSVLTVLLPAGGRRAPTPAGSRA